MGKPVPVLAALIQKENLRRWRWMAIRCLDLETCAIARLHLKRLPVFSGSPRTTSGFISAGNLWRMSPIQSDVLTLPQRTSPSIALCALFTTAAFVNGVVQRLGLKLKSERHELMRHPELIYSSMCLFPPAKKKEKKTPLPLPKIPNQIRILHPKGIVMIYTPVHQKRKSRRESNQHRTRKTRPKTIPSLHETKSNISAPTPSPPVTGRCRRRPRLPSCSV